MCPMMNNEWLFDPSPSSSASSTSSSQPCNSRWRTRQQQWQQQHSHRNALHSLSDFCFLSSSFFLSFVSLPSFLSLSFLGPCWTVTASSALYLPAFIFLFSLLLFVPYIYSPSFYYSPLTIPFFGTNYIEWIEVPIAFSLSAFSFSFSSLLFITLIWSLLPYIHPPVFFLSSFIHSFILFLSILLVFSFPSSLTLFFFSSSSSSLASFLLSPLVHPPLLHLVVLPSLDALCANTFPRHLRSRSRLNSSLFLPLLHRSHYILIYPLLPPNLTDTLHLSQLWHWCSNCYQSTELAYTTTFLLQLHPHKKL